MNYRDRLLLGAAAVISVSAASFPAWAASPRSIIDTTAGTYSVNGGAAAPIAGDGTVTVNDPDPYGITVQGDGTTSPVTVQINNAIAGAYGGSGINSLATGGEINFVLGEGGSLTGSSNRHGLNLGVAGPVFTVTTSGENTNLIQGLGSGGMGINVGPAVNAAINNDSTNSVIIGEYGIDVGNFATVSVTNSGRIEGTTASGGTGVYINQAATATVLNGETGILAGNNGIISYSNDVVIDNAGTILATGLIPWGVVAGYGGVGGALSITNRATGVISAIADAGSAADSLALHVGGDTGTIVNDGLISLTTAAGTTGKTIEFASGTTTSFTNGSTGVISAQGDGSAAAISVAATGTVTAMSLGGTVSSSTGNGLEIMGTVGGLDVSGTLSSSAAGAAALSLQNDMAGAIANSGTIKTTGAGGTAIAVTGDYAIAGGLGNTGKIDAGATGTAIDLSAASSAATTITNSGEIIGAVKLGDATSLDLAGGSVTGDIVGGATEHGAVTFLSGVTSLTGNIGQGNKVGSVAIDNGATLAVTRATTIASTTGLVNDGVLDLGSNAVTVSGGPITGSGTLQTTLGATGHGYLINSDAATDLHAMTILPTVTTRLTNGMTYVLVEDYAGSAAAPQIAASLPGRRKLTASLATGSGVDANGLSYDAGDLVLVASVEALPTSVITNTNSAQTLANYAGSDPTLAAMSDAINNLTDKGEIDKAGAQLRPEANGGTYQASMGATNQALNTIAARNDAVRSEQTASTGLSTGEALRGLGVWGQGFGAAVDQDRRLGVDGYDADTYGLAFGADSRVLDAARIGLSFAYARTDVDDKGTRSGSGQKIDSYIGSLYGSYTGTPWYVDGSLTYGRHDYDSTRLVNFAGAPSQVAKASFAGQQYGAKTEVGYPLAVGAATVTPLASLAYNHLSQDGYTETGAAGANLVVDGSDGDSLRSGLGTKLSASFAMPGGLVLKPNARAVWLHEFYGTAPDQTAAFAAGGGAFITSGLKLARDAADLGVGLDLTSDDSLTLSARYDVELKDRYTGHTGSLQIRSEF